MVLKDGWKKIPRLRGSRGNISTHRVCHVCKPTVEIPVQPSTVNRHVQTSDPFWLPPASKATRLSCVARPFTTGFHVVLHSLYISPRRSWS